MGGLGTVSWCPRGHRERAKQAESLEWRWEGLGGGGPGSGGQSCWRRAGATAKAERVSGVWEGILECEDGECEVQVGSQNEMLIGMRKEACLGRDQG